MKKCTLLLALVMSSLMLGGCAKNTNSQANDPKTQKEQETDSVTKSADSANAPEATKAPEHTKAPTATSAPTKAPTPVPEEGWYEEMIETSLLSTGNNARLKKVIEKAKAGEDVYIAGIGGSVTEGAGASSNKKGYFYQFVEAFTKKYAPGDGSNVHVMNAGLGGTPSSLGILRYQRDVVDSLGHTPDLLLIEFSVNDYQEETGGRAYEALVSEGLKGENDPAVVLVFAVFRNKWNLQENVIGIGKHYELPMVSIKNAIAKPFSKKYLTDAKFFADEYHPTTYGHTVMSDCLMYLVDTVDRMEADEMSPLPAEPKKSLAFENTVMIDEETKGIEITKGSFSLQDAAVQTAAWNGKNAFPKNWKHDAKAGNDSLLFTLTCKNFLLNYKTSSNGEFGKAEVYVDGTLVRTLEGKTSGGWNNSNVILVLDTDTAAEHVIEVKMAPGSEEKTFTVLAAGFTE